MMKVAAISAHVANDRMDRVLLIATTIGWGEEILRVWSWKEDAYMILTSTGVVLVTGRNGKLITAYIAHRPVVMWMYREAGYNRVPAAIYAKVQKNAKYLRD